MKLLGEGPVFTLDKEGAAIGRARWEGDTLAELTIDPAWRGRGYGSYFLKELLRRRGGYDREEAT